MKILLIGHKNRINKIEKIIETNYKNIKVESLEYSSISETDKVCSYIKEREKDIDAILFTGEVPFQLINKKIVPSVTCDFMRRDRSSVLIELLKIVRCQNIDIRKVSFDTYREELIRKIYEEIGFKNEELQLQFSPVNISEEKYIQKTFNFHYENYKNKNIDCCVTALNNVYEKLKEKSVPCYILDPSIEVIKQSVDRIQLKNLARINEKTKIVVVAIYIDYPHDNSIANRNEYQLFTIRMNVADKIYSFVQRLQAAVVEEDSNQYLIFCTKDTLESETNNYKSIEILQNISKDYASNVSIGIGHGITAREAKFSAIIGMNKAKTHGENTAYVVYEGDKIVGPITYSKSDESKQIIIDEKYNKISRETGVSINKLFTIHGMKHQYKKDSFTSKEISQELHLSIRSVNKILNQLEEKEYVKMVGKKYDGSAGRPSRLIKILF